MPEELTAKPYYRNPRQITKKRAERLNDTLERLGDLSGIVHNIRSDMLVGGHQRRNVFGKDATVEITERYDEPDEQGTVAHGYVIWKGKRYAYRQVDWDEETMAEANIAANLGAGDWDWDVFANQWEPMELTEWGFDTDLLTTWGNDYGGLVNFLGSEEAEQKSDAAPQVDRAAELQKEWGVELGQLWRLPSRVEGNEHRLICGDCTDAGVVERVMTGEKAAVNSTDPPYGHGLDKEGQTIGLSKKYGPVAGDATTETARMIYNSTAFLADVNVWWGANHWGGNLLDSSPGWLVWDKDHHGMTYADAELAWTNVDMPVRVFRHAWSGNHRASEKGMERYHINQKPVALFEWYLPMITELHDLVLDCCLGVAGQLIAAENLSRQARCIEISPGYCAVALQRYADAFNIQPELIETL